MIYKRILNIKEDAIQGFSREDGITELDLSVENLEGNDLYKSAMLTDQKLGVLLKTVYTYDAMKLANSMVEEDDRVNIDYHFDSIIGILMTLQEFVEYDEIFAQRVLKGQKDVDWQRDEKGRRIYSKKLKFDKRIQEEIKEANNECEKLKKVWEWEFRERIDNCGYCEEVALLEEYFNQFMQGSTTLNTQSREEIYKNGWVSMIEKVKTLGLFQHKVTNDDKNPFCIAGIADIVSRDTLYYVTRSYYSTLWATLYLNILNLIYQKPLLSVLKVSDNGLLFEEDIYTFNKDEEAVLLKLCETLLEREVTYDEVMETIGEIFESSQTLHSTNIGLDRSKSNFLHNYIDSIVEGVEDLFEKNTIPFLKKFFSQDESFVYKDSFASTIKAVGRLMLDVVTSLCEIRMMMRCSDWRLIVFHVIKNNNFLAIFGQQAILQQLSKAEIFLRIVQVLAPIFFSYSNYKRKSYSEYPFAIADCRRVSLELFLNRTQREELDKVLTSFKFLGKYDIPEERKEKLKRCILRKEISKEYFCEDDITFVRMPFKFISSLRCKDVEMRKTADVALMNLIGLLIEKVEPAYYFSSNGNMEARITVTCKGISWQYNKQPTVIFTFTDKTPHEVLYAFFKTFWIEPCTYNFDEWVGLYGDCIILGDGEGFPATIERRNINIEFTETPCKSFKKEPIFSF